MRRRHYDPGGSKPVTHTRRKRAAQDHFERGLSATVDLHLRQFNSIDRLLKFAPESVWSQLKAPQAFDFSLMTVHDLSALGNGLRRLPFDRIAYLPETRAHHAFAAQG